MAQNFIDFKVNLIKDNIKLNKLFYFRKIKVSYAEISMDLDSIKFFVLLVYKAKWYCSIIIKIAQHGHGMNVEWACKLSQRICFLLAV